MFTPLLLQELGDAASDPEDIGDVEVSSLASYDSLIVGAQLAVNGL